MVLDKEKRFKHKKRPAWSHSDKESVDPAFRHKKGVVGQTHTKIPLLPVACHHPSPEGYRALHLPHPLIHLSTFLP